MQKCIRRAEEETALRMAYELYITSTFHEEKDVEPTAGDFCGGCGLWGHPGACFVKTMYDLHKEYPYMDGDRPIFFMHAIRYMCRCQKERSTDHIKNIIMREFAAGYVLRFRVCNRHAYH